MKAVQSKMARVALGLTVKQLAELSGVSHNTIDRLEAGDASLKPKTLAAIRSALESAGVVFSDDNGMVCVKLAKGEGGE